MKNLGAKPHRDKYRTRNTEYRSERTKKEFAAEVAQGAEKIPS
jgi:hypothetical protein